MITPRRVSAWLTRYAELIAEQADHLTELDSAIGDADHGANMARGTRGALGALAADDVAAQLKGYGMALLSQVGGTAGPLYGSLFIGAAKALAELEEIDELQFATALRAGLTSLVLRGRTDLDDKTMVDALSPAINELRERLAAGDEWPDAVRAARAEAERGRDHTVGLVARKGRASYLGDRSKGHMDPGAASAALLFAALEGGVR